MYPAVPAYLICQVTYCNGLVSLHPVLQRAHDLQINPLLEGLSRGDNTCNVHVLTNFARLFLGRSWTELALFICPWYWRLKNVCKVLVVHCTKVCHVFQLQLTAVASLQILRVIPSIALCTDLTSLSIVLMCWAKSVASLNIASFLPFGVGRNCLSVMPTFWSTCSHSQGSRSPNCSTQVLNYIEA